LLEKAKGTSSKQQKKLLEEQEKLHKMDKLDHQIPNPVPHQHEINHPDLDPYQPDLSDLQELKSNDTVSTHPHLEHEGSEQDGLLKAENQQEQRRKLIYLIKTCKELYNNTMKIIDLSSKWKSPKPQPDGFEPSIDVYPKEFQ